MIRPSEMFTMNTLPTHKRTSGFTLIEVTIVVAILGIIAAIALPSYLAHVKKTRRTDATVLLSEAAGEQFRFYSEYNSYAEDLSELGYSDATMTTEQEFYTVSVESADATRFVLVAEPVAGKQQEQDADCPQLRIDSAGLKSPADCW